MATELRIAKFGAISNKMTVVGLANATQILISFLDGANKTNLINEPDAVKEVFQIAKEQIGDDFNAFLVANYRNGIGARKSFVKAVVLWLKGEIDNSAVTSTLRADFARLNWLPQTEQATTPILYDTTRKDDIELKIREFNSDHMYRLFALLGPELIAKFILSLNGVKY